MFHSDPNHGFSRRPLFNRIERAAAGLNPTLILIAIGLVILNILFLLSFLERRGLSSNNPSGTSCAAVMLPPPGARPGGTQ